MARGWREVVRRKSLAGLVACATWLVVTLLFAMPTVAVAHLLRQAAPGLLAAFLLLAIPVFVAMPLGCAWRAYRWIWPRRWWG